MRLRLFANAAYDLTDRHDEQMWQTIVHVALKTVGVDVGLAFLKEKRTIVAFAGEEG